MPDMIWTCRNVTETIPEHTFKKFYSPSSPKEPQFCGRKCYFQFKKAHPEEFNDWNLPQNVEKRVRTRQSNGGYTPSSETREKIRNTVQGLHDSGYYLQFDYSKDEETRQKISETVKKLWASGHYDSVDWASFCTPERRAQHSAFMKKRYADGLGSLKPFYGPMSEEQKQRISKALKGRPGRPMSPESIAKMKKSLQDKIMSGEWHPQSVKKKFPYEVEGQKTIYFRSNTEASFVRKLDRFGVEWVYEPKRFRLSWCTYLPDFYLPEYDLWVEVKGYLDATSAKKIKSFREETGLRLQVVFCPDVESEELGLDIERVGA